MTNNNLIMAMVVLVLAGLVCIGMVQAGEIHTAVKKGDLVKVEVLLKTNPALITERDEKGASPLHYATIAKKLWKVKWVGPSLFEAVTQGDKTMIELLLVNGADVNAKNNAGFTALHNAALNGDKYVVELLLNHGANVNAKTDSGLTPLHCVAQSSWQMDQPGAGKIVIRGARDLAQLLIDTGADVSAEDAAGITPLQDAERCGHTDLMDLLRKHGSSQ